MRSSSCSRWPPPGGVRTADPAEQRGDAPGGAAVTRLTELDALLQERTGLDLVRTRFEESQAGLELAVWILGDAEVVQAGGRLAPGGTVVALHPPKTVGTRLARRVTTVLGELPCG